MKLLKIIVITFLSLSLLLGCSYTSSKNQLPDSILKEDSNADFFIINSIVFINAENIDWIEKIELRKGDLLGKITKTNVKSNFKNWNATQLKKGTLIYQVIEQDNIVLVELENKFIPYLKYVEG